ncbi:MAG: hypothetical protein NXI20_24950 [bacterium]|nr:hypothetical protein [bacterium]
MRFRVLVIVLLISFTAANGQTKIDTLQLRNGDIITGLIKSKLLGFKGGELIILDGSNRREIPMQDVDFIIKDMANYKAVSFNIGNQKYNTFGRQYFFGEINLFEVVIKPFGKVQVISKDNITTALLDRTYKYTLSALLKECEPQAELQKVEPANLIALLTEYHNCQNTSFDINIEKSTVKHYSGLDVSYSTSFGPGEIEFVNILVPAIGFTFDPYYVQSTSFEESTFDLENSQTIGLSWVNTFGNFYITPSFRKRSTAFSTDRFRLTFEGTSANMTIEQSMYEAGINLGLILKKHGVFRPYLAYGWNKSLFNDVSLEINTFGLQNLEDMDNINSVDSEVLLDYKYYSNDSFEMGVLFKMKTGSIKVNLVFGQTKGRFSTTGPVINGLLNPDPGQDAQTEGVDYVGFERARFREKRSFFGFGYVLTLKDKKVINRYR